MEDFLPRILMVSQPTDAGVANVVLSHANAYVDLGWEVHLACPTSSGYLAKKAGKIGVHVHSWAAVRQPTRGVVREVSRLKEIGRTVNPDVVHLHSAKAGLVGRISFRGKRPTIFQPHAWSFQAATGLVRSAACLWERLAASRYTDLTLCVSEDERRIGARYECLGKATAVVPNGIDLEHYAPVERGEARRDLRLPSEAFIVVCVGRLATQKGQDLLIEAWREIVRHRPNARLMLVGSGPLEDRLKRMRAPQVEFVGTREDVRPWLAAADLVAFPSRWEASSLALAEAMAMGRCIVTTKFEGSTEMLENEGAIAPLEDANALAVLISTRLSDRGLRAEEEQANRLIAQKKLDGKRASRQTAALTLEVMRSDNVE